MSIAPRLGVGAALLAGAVLAACGGGGDGGDGRDSGGTAGSLEEVLRRMVLQPEDLPRGFESVDEAFASNEDRASSSDDPEARLELLEKWGRLLGYEITYQPTGEGLEESPVQGANVASNLYSTDEGAIESFADALMKARETDWESNYAALTSFQLEEIDATGLADQIVWLRISGFQLADDGSAALVTDDLIFFRVGRERGFLSVLASSADTADRQRLVLTVTGWLRRLVDNVKAALAEPVLDAQEG